MNINPERLLKLIGKMLGEMERRMLGLIEPMQRRIEVVESKPDPDIDGVLDLIDKLTEVTDLAEQQQRDDLAAVRERLAAAEASLDGVDDRIELARVNSELRLEQARGLIKDSAELQADAEQLFEALQKELNAAQRENARLMEEIDKAAAERLEHVGPYRAGETYRRNHIVMRDGSSYICVADETTADPREKLDQPHWRLFAKGGDRGPQGPQGEAGKRGLQGAKGDPGPAGADGAGLRSISTSGMAAVFVTSDGQAHRFDLAKAVEELVERRLKELGK
jgi:DNA-binding protein H-NS